MVGDDTRGRIDRCVVEAGVSPPTLQPVVFVWSGRIGEHGSLQLLVAGQAAIQVQ